MIGGNVINILGNWVLIYGVAGFPELGLLGAGISTLVSRIDVYKRQHEQLSGKGG